MIDEAVQYPNDLTDTVVLNLIRFELKSESWGLRGGAPPPLASKKLRQCGNNSDLHDDHNSTDSRLYLTINVGSEGGGAVPQMGRNNMAIKIICSGWIHFA